ncbi:MAG: hemolysin III family protein [Flavobacteriaceae bacterium]|nr:hemolysin III family protein [Flavobacteriaceae bacterium]
MSHATGIVLSIVALVLLLIYTTNGFLNTFSIIVYSITLLFLYSASTLYHAITHEKWKFFFRKLDHIGIYFLIAGTYTPVALISLIDGNGWTIFWTVWGISIAGTFLKIFFTGKFDKLSLLLYLCMGWLIVFDFKNLWEVQSVLGITLLGLGGLFYTLGTIFYAVEKIPYNHAIWHSFVLAGSIFHFFFIFIDVI